MTYLTVFCRSIWITGHDRQWNVSTTYPALHIMCISLADFSCFSSANFPIKKLVKWHSSSKSNKQTKVPLNPNNNHLVCDFLAPNKCFLNSMKDFPSIASRTSLIFLEEYKSCIVVWCFWHPVTEAPTWRVNSRSQEITFLGLHLFFSPFLIHPGCSALAVPCGHNLCSWRFISST